MPPRLLAVIAVNGADWTIAELGNSGFTLGLAFHTGGINSVRHV
jgi:hypothetical protein